MAAHVSDWRDSLSPASRRGGKRLTKVVMFVGCLVLDDDPNGNSVVCFQQNVDHGGRWGNAAQTLA
jgi:hypothetical protein